jgi:hypothetical protein
MPYYLPSGTPESDGTPAEIAVQSAPVEAVMADLKVFWGPDICRLEYLMHLVDTGRIKDERCARPRTVSGSASGMRG